MFTFLPRQYEKIVIKDYRRRSVTMFFSLCILLSLLSIILIMPTFINLYFQNKAAVFEKSQAETGEGSQDLAEITKKIADVKSEMALLNSVSGKSMIVIIDRFLAQPRSGISISRISVTRGSGDKGISLQIQGLADNRNSLVAFTDRLETEPSFSNVNLPVSSLARNRDIPFDMSINVKP